MAEPTRNQVMLVEQIIQFSEKENLFRSQEKILLAVSGGVDSVAMLHLLRKTDTDLGVAHCNFQLRGNASDEDERFVRQLAENYQLPFFTIKFDTEKKSELWKCSIQETARKLRYEYLEKIRSKENFDWIATAHHLDDSIETVLFNLGRGSGIRGLHGILPKKERVIRPLLCFRKNDILDFATENDIQFREDASNLTTKYTRNQIRHQLIPAWENIFPDFSKTMANTIEHIRSAESIYTFAIRQIQQDITADNQPNSFSLSRKKLTTFPAPRAVLFEILNVYGFSATQCEQMLAASTGAEFVSEQYRVISGRDLLWVIRQGHLPEKIHIDQHCRRVFYDRHMITFEQVEEAPTTFSDNPGVAYLNADKLTYPLLLRTWEPGDRFQPLGMQGKHQKVKDFLTDRKVFPVEKEKAKVVVSKGEICWIPGYRIDERFKISSTHKNILRLELIRF